MDDNIGWYWKVLGVILFLVSGALAGYKLYVEHSFSTADVILAGIFVIASLIIIRPGWMDKNFKEILDRLPFVSYRKPPDA